MANEIKFPIALTKDNHQLVNARDVPSGLKCNCYCPECEQDLNAITGKGKQRAHFRHKPDSQCRMNYETFIHWVTKEIFKSLISFRLPPILFADLDRDYRLHLREEIGEFLSVNELIEANEDEYDDLKSQKPLFTQDLVLQNTSEVKIEKCLDQKTFKSKYGNVIPDIIIVQGNNKLFIEPFVASQIDDEKLRKLVDLDVTTVSIDLNTFVERHSFDFTIEELKEFLINNLSFKKWVHLSRIKKEKLKNKWLKEILPNKISKCKEIQENNKGIQILIDDCNSKILGLNKEIELLDKKVKDLKNELGVVTLDNLLNENTL